MEGSYKKSEVGINNMPKCGVERSRKITSNASLARRTLSNRTAKTSRRLGESGI